MSASFWKCHEHVAHLDLDCFQATLDATRPADGLMLSGAPGDRAIHAKLLGLVLPRHRPGDVESLVECSARRDDMVIAYQGSTGRPFRVDAVWRALRGGPAEAFLAAVDLIVSVRTELLDSRPEVGVQSVLPVAVTFCPPGPAEAPGCTIWRLPGEELSYAEMIIPADFHDDEAAPDAPGGGNRLRRRLFPRSLEKGVILRARCAGLSCPAATIARAAACYAAFAAAAPPLDAF